MNPKLKSIVYLILRWYRHGSKPYDLIFKPQALFRTLEASSLGF